VTLFDWLLFLHVFGAFALVGALVFFWGLILFARHPPDARSGAAMNRTVRPANIAVMAGTLMTLVFGVWLAIEVDGYELWDGWILASLALWAVGAETGRRAGAAYGAVAQRVEAAAASGTMPSRGELTARNGLLWHSISSAAVLTVLVLMIWKPGA
jgi:uncharacterized membrane protein